MCIEMLKGSESDWLLLWRGSGGFWSRLGGPVGVIWRGLGWDCGRLRVLGMVGGSAAGCEDPEDHYGELGGPLWEVKESAADCKPMRREASSWQWACSPVGKKQTRKSAIPTGRRQ